MNGRPVFTPVLIGFALRYQVHVLGPAIETKVALFQSDRRIAQVLSDLLSLVRRHVVGCVFFFQFRIVGHEMERIARVLVHCTNKIKINLIQFISLYISIKLKILIQNKFK